MAGSGSRPPLEQWKKEATSFHLNALALREPARGRIEPLQRSRTETPPSQHRTRHIRRALTAKLYRTYPTLLESVSSRLHCVFDTRLERYLFFFCARAFIHQASSTSSIQHILLSRASRGSRAETRAELGLGNTLPRPRERHSFLYFNTVVTPFHNRTVKAPLFFSPLLSPL